MSTPFSYRRQVGSDDTFLARYLDHMQQSETPHAYDFWSGVWALGAALGRGVVVDRPRAPVYSNWYVVLVADSGITRKSSAVRAADNVVRGVVNSDAALYISGRTGAEKLEAQIASRDHGRTIISVSEMVTVFGRGPSGMAVPGLLTDLYDCPAHREGGGTISRGANTLRNVHVSLLSASTPTWLATAINPDVIEGGFTSRCIFVYETRRKRAIAWADNVSHANDTDGVGLGQSLAEVASAAQEVGTYVLTDRAMSRFKSWYKHRGYARDSFTQSFESREDAHVLKLALCLTANDREDIIGHRHINRAIRIIGRVKHQAGRLFEGGIRPDRTVLAVNKVVEVLIEWGAAGCPQSVITAKVRHLADGRTVRLILELMHEMQMVDHFEPKRRGMGRPTQLWRATKLISEPTSRESLIAAMES